MTKRDVLWVPIVTILVVGLGIGITLLQNGPSGITGLISGLQRPSAEIQQAEANFQSGNYQEAFRLYSIAIEKGSDLAQAYAGRASVFVKARRFLEASADYSASLEIERTPQNLASRCNVYRLLARFDLALADCQAAIELDPEYLEGYLALSSLYLEQGQNEDALEVALEAIDHQPEAANAHYTLAQVFLIQGKTAQAIDSYSAAIRFNPDNPQFYWDRGFAYYMTGDFAAAKADMQAVIDHGDPQNDGELIYKAGSLLNSLQGSP